MNRSLALVVCLSSALPGAALAAKCATGNVPGATLLAPYFRVSRNGVLNASSDIPDLPAQTDTLMSITNAGGTALIAHATVFSKYGVPVLDFNIPLTAYDVAFFRMKDILNGKLNVNPLTQSGAVRNDPCGINQANGVYAPITGFGRTRYVRFANPDASDAKIAISRYATPAFDGAFRQRVWDSLDESGDVTQLAGPGQFVLDTDTACTGGSYTLDGRLEGDFSGYVTFDVVNFCTTFDPTEPQLYTNDALATAGWAAAGYTPNALIGDVFYVDSSAVVPHISGDPMVALEFQPGIDWNTRRSFYGRYWTRADAAATATAPEAFRFVGDGREALGSQYGFRYLSDEVQGLRSWAVIWRADRYGTDTNLCAFWNSQGEYGAGLYERSHALATSLFDNDENQFVTGGMAGSFLINLFTFLETQRIDLQWNGEINPGAFRGGYVDVLLPGSQDGQAYVSVQHSGPGSLLSVGHGAALLNRASCDIPFSPAH